MKKFLIVFLALPLLGSPPLASAQAKSCCNMQSGEFLAIPKAQCDATPGHISYPPSDPQDAMKAMVCFQKTQQMGNDLLGQYGISIPGMSGGMPPGVNIPGMKQQTSAPANAETYPCCNVESGAFEGSMAADVCREQGSNFYPDTPEFLQQTEVCRASPGGGGGENAPAWDVEDYEENIQNGGMENWRDENRMNDFSTFGVAPELPRDYPIDIQVAFRDPDAHTGASSVRLKNLDILPQLPPEAKGAMAAYMGKSNIMMPAGIMTCKEPCPLEQTDPKAGNISVFASLRAEDIQSHVCGAYKGYIGAEDRLNINVSIVQGSGIAGFAERTFTRNAADWVEFAMPVQTVPGKSVPTSGKVGISARFESRAGILAGWGGSPLSEAKVDSVHFCSPFGITAYHPAVIAGNTRSEIPDREEETLGVQTFVNLDNDDKDAKYDFEDDVVSDDNELVRIRLYIPAKSLGKVELKAPSVGSLYQIWTKADKSEKFKDVNTRKEISLILDKSSDGERYEKELWIEALKPSSKPADMPIEFIYENALDNNAETSDKIVLTALGIENIEINGKENSVDDKDELDDDPNFSMSDSEEKNLRIFPGRRFDGDKPEDKPRDIVEIKATLNVEPVRPVKVNFRSMDVDDPSAWDDEVDRLASSVDNRGKVEGAGLRGMFPDSGKAHIEVEFTGDSETFDFQVTMRPGDNFRIVGGGDIMTLMELENDDGAIPEYILDHLLWIYDPMVMAAQDDPAIARIPEHNKYVSDVLTVWRKLFLEIDTMTPVEKHVVDAKIAYVRPNAPHEIVDSAGNVTSTLQMQRVTLDTNLFKSLPKESQAFRSGFENNYRWGKMTVNGKKYDTKGNTAYGSGGDDVYIVLKSGDTPLSNDDIGAAITLVDDDPQEDGSALVDLQTQHLKEAFAPAYVLPVWEGVPNKTKTIPFKLHFKSDEPDYLKKVFQSGFDGRVYHDEPDFWLVYLLNAFQGKLNEDGDGEGGLSGMTDGTKAHGLNGYGAVVFQESGRETAMGYAAAGSGTGWQLKDVAPHEIAHLFGAQHAGKGLMSYDKNKTDKFEPRTLDKIRTREHP